MRYATFLVSVCSSVALIGALNWWVDPFADRYERTAVSEAFAHDPDCLVAHTVVGERTWPEFKLDLVKRRQARTVVVGTSRVWKLAARSSRERFVNLAIPGMGLEMLPAIFARLAEVTSPPLRIELGLEEFWLGSRTSDAAFGDDTLDDLKNVLSGETLRATVSTLRRAPGALRNPRALRPWQKTAVGDRCVVDRDQSVAMGAANAWGTDGTWHWQWDLTGAQPPDADLYVTTHRVDFVGARIDPHKLRVLERALDFARQHGWQVVAFSPPYTPKSLEYVRTDPATAGLWRDFALRIPNVVRQYGFKFADLSDVRRIPCNEREFTWNDGAHIDDACSVRLRAKVSALSR